MFDRKKWNIQYKKDNRQKIRDLKIKYLGDKCFICKRENKTLMAHEIYYKPHKRFWNMLPRDVEELLKPNNFVHLCYICHKNVHWVFDNMGFTWKQICKHLK